MDGAKLETSSKEVDRKRIREGLALLRSILASHVVSKMIIDRRGPDSPTSSAYPSTREAEGEVEACRDSRLPAVNEDEGGLGEVEAAMLRASGLRWSSALGLCGDSIIVFTFVGVSRARKSCRPKVDLSSPHV
jgi:hypothetical protein